jgi:hypothetical protein
MVENTYFQILTYSSLVLFNLFAIVGIIAFIVVIKSVSRVRAKVDETMERVQDSAINIGEAGINFASVISQFAIFKPKKGLKSFIAQIFRD